ncbi:DUF2339 domain-containing protein [Novosphingopyxis sp.]|uniref:DUF2339 domain-containing protein n=1 Tax=Novosphingopyxis sp. TaxID=2709690 RepID=UPI003B5995E6
MPNVLTTDTFLIVSVLIYVLTGVFYTRATPGPLGNIVDTSLLFGPAIAGFALQVGLVHESPFGSAFAALGFAALYLGVASWAMRFRSDGLRTLNETMLAIGVGFVTLAVPLALGARWTSAAWALEGAGAFWVGMRQARWLPRLFGIALQLVAAMLYLSGMAENTSPVPLANPGFIGAMLIALAALATAWWMREPLRSGTAGTASNWTRLYEGYEVKLPEPTFLFSFAFWWLAWVVEIGRVPPSVYADAPGASVFGAITQVLLAMLVYIVSAWAAQIAARRLDWPVAQWPSLATLAPLALAFLVVVGSGASVLNSPDWMIWIVAIALHGWMLRDNDLEPEARGQFALVRASHVGGLWLATAMLANSLSLGIDRAGLWDTAWAQIVFLVAAIAILGVLTWWTRGALADLAAPARWPLSRHAIAYGWYGAIPIAALIFAGSLVTALVSAGEAAPLPYIPVMNPLEITLGLSLAVLAVWHRATLSFDPAVPGVTVLRRPWALASLAALGFVMINTVWLRIAHHFLAVPWSADALHGSFVVQTGLAILWTLVALALMVLAHRRGARIVWLIGAGLLGITVVKLLLVDMNNADGGARIVAFIAVGLLMLVVGYFAPLPPRSAEIADAAPGQASSDRRQPVA